MSADERESLGDGGAGSNLNAAALKRTPVINDSAPTAMWAVATSAAFPVQIVAAPSVT